MSEKPKAVDVDSIDLDKLKEKTTDLPGLIEYAHSVGGFSIVPTKEGHIKASAQKAMQEQTQMQLDMLLEQMKTIAGQAQKLKERAEMSSQIYEAKMSFKPVVGHHYYLYEKKDSTKTLSLVSPTDWNNNCPYTFLHKVKLLADHTWIIVDSGD
jgi:hypothetical protein